MDGGDSEGKKGVPLALFRPESDEKGEAEAEEEGAALISGRGRKLRSSEERKMRCRGLLIPQMEKRCRRKEEGSICFSLPSNDKLARSSPSRRRENLSPGRAWKPNNSLLLLLLLPSAFLNGRGEKGEIRRQRRKPLSLDRTFGGRGRKHN